MISFLIKNITTNSSQKAHSRDTKYAHRRERLQIKNIIKRDLLNENE